MKLPLLSGRQVLAALQRLGFVEIHRKGSHIKMEHPDGRRIVFPFHDEVDRFTLKGALRDASVASARFPQARPLSTRTVSPNHALQRTGAGGGVFFVVESVLAGLCRSASVR